MPAEDEDRVEVPNNCFVNAFVKCPCCIATIVGLIAIITTFATIRVIRSEGEDLIGQAAAMDINDVRSREREAFEAVEIEIESMLNPSGTGAKCEKKSMGVKRKCDTKVYPPLTQSGEVVLFVFKAKEGNNVFTTDGVAQARTVEDRMVTHPEHSTYCKRSDKSGLSTDCEKPMSPLNLFYAPGVDIKATVGQIDALDGQVDGLLNTFLSPGVAQKVSNLHATMLLQIAAISAGTRQDPCAAGANPRTAGLNWTVLNCMVNSQQGLDLAVVSLYKALAPISVAFQRPRGTVMQDPPSVLKLAAYMRTIGSMSAEVDYYFDKGFSLSNQVSKYSRGSVRYGLPLPGYINKDDRSDDQEKKFVDWFDKQFSNYLKETKEAGSIEVLFFATPLIRREFLNIILFDSLRVLVSLVLVFIWLWIQTNSIVIALAGIMEIILSIPIAFFFYYVIFQFKYFDGLNFMTLFIVVAIGADDIFVFMDQYKLSAHRKEVCVDLQTRMNWVYSRASWAMFITSATTCCAFVVTAVNPLPNIQSFGIFSAFVIIADYILVITWFPACVVLYHNYLESRPCCCLCHRCQDMFPCTVKMETSTARIANMGPNEHPPQRLLQRFISGPFAGLIKRFAPFIVIFFLLLLIPWGILAGGIQPLSRNEEALPADHPFQRLWTISGEEFPASSQTPNTQVHLVWGVKDMDMSDVNLLRQGASKKGTLVWDDTFQFDMAAQQHLWNVCEEVRKMEAPNLVAFLSRDTDKADNPGFTDCPIFDWKNYLLASNLSFPLPLSMVPSTVPSFLAAKTSDKWGRNTTYKEKWETKFGYDMALMKVRAVIITVASSLQQRAAHSPDKLKENYDHFEVWIDEVNSASGRLPAPVTANKAFHTSDGDFNGPNWIWMHTQSVFRKSAIMGSLIGTVLAFVVILLATQQIIIALASFVTIAAILVSVLAMMKMASYELGSTASICITILAGFAVDYVVHLAHAFNHSKKPTRAEKFQEAFDDIGVSVLSGMVTSMVSAIVLLTCTLQFFAKFGFFLIFTVAWAWVWGNFFFMGVLRIIGPDDGTHWILQLPYSILPAWPKCSKQTGTPAEAATEPNAASP
mmetsp:Transcript_49552/g.152939  ORF Transcript_49552/g.152939 Transcript_49552/m.152939 type:complete len:1090 (-) Transcript_49552:354-3623(-)